MKILVAEDEDSILQTYQLALKSRNHEIFSASDGEQCLKIFTEHLDQTRKRVAGESQTNSAKVHEVTPFDLVILDHRMPKKNGLEVAEQMLSDAPAQRIVIASAYTHELKIPSNYEHTLELLQKPFGIDVLFSTVENIQASRTAKYVERPSMTNKARVSLSDDNPSAIGLDQNVDKISFDFGPAWLQF